MTKRLLLLAIFLAGCPDQVGEQCPSNTTSLGQFNLLFTGQHPSGECTVTQPDGSVNALVLEDGGVRGGTFCYATSADGGGQVQLIIATKGVRTSDLLLDGGFKFGGSSAAVTGTSCDALDGGTCPVAIDETFAGYLMVSPDAGFAPLPDGGLPLVTSVNGKLVDTLSSTNTSHCVCNIPCAVTYGITGTRF